MKGVKGLSPEERLGEATVTKGFSMKRAIVNSTPYYREPNEDSSEPQYNETWRSYKLHVDIINFPSDIGKIV